MLSVKEAALSLGFDACGIAKAEALTEDAVFFKQWFSLGNHADMHFLERNFEKRIDPRELVSDCKSIVVVLMNYFPDQKQLDSAPQIAKYAYSSIDYHQILKTKLNELEQKIVEMFGSDSVSTHNQHLFVDSAPVLERRWAQRAGLGWIGKNKQLISKGLGSYTFIGILMLNIEMQYDIPVPNRCGTCTRCIDACPTNALNNNSLDARKCISDQTIESKNDINVELQDKLSNCAFGCDICADVCPWNAKWAKPHTHKELNQLSESEEFNALKWNFETWTQLSEQKFDDLFKNSALKRAGFTKLKRNIDILRLH
jgi:epoxyqueuosine reductase